MGMPSGNKTGGAKPVETEALAADGEPFEDALKIAAGDGTEIIVESDLPRGVKATLSRSRQELADIRRG